MYSCFHFIFMEQFKYHVLIARIAWCIGNKICHTMIKQYFAVIIFNGLALLLGNIFILSLPLRFPAFLADDSIAFDVIPVRDDMKKCTPLIFASSSSSLRRFAAKSFIERSKSSSFTLHMHLQLNASIFPAT